MNRKKVFSCIGTRADIIKMSVLLKELNETSSIISYVCASGQHKELALKVIDELKIHVDKMFDIMKPKQTLSYVLSMCLTNFTSEMNKVKPDIVLVHGDTTTALAGTLAASYLHIPVFHVEAGLRTFLSTPFPEELHRKIITSCASFFACPDSTSVNNLILEKVNESNIFLTGNTISDLLNITISKNYLFEIEDLNRFSFEKQKAIVVTLHRNELDINEIVHVCNIIKNLVKKFNDVVFFWPVHPNPKIKNIVECELAHVNNVYLLPTVGVVDMHNLIYRSFIIMTDSAGVQEEAFLLSRTIILLRKATERPEYFDNTKSLMISLSNPFIDNEIERMITELYQRPTVLYPNQLLISESNSVSKKIVTAIKDICLNKECL